MQITIIDFMSLDGVVQAPGQAEEDTDAGFPHGGWSIPYMDPEVMGPVIAGVMEQSEALLFGRKTWQGMAAAWPERAGQDPYADAMNSIRKYVISTTLDADEAASRWNNTELLDAGDPIGAVRALKDQGDGRLQVWGSVSVAQQLVQAGLVDEYVLFVEPVLVGTGKRLFPDDAQKRPLELISVEQAKTGTLICRYRPAG